MKLSLYRHFDFDFDLMSPPAARTADPQEPVPVIVRPRVIHAKQSAPFAH
jgi:hypothetical protein